MLCSTELMQAALVSSTGEMVQCGMTCGGTLTDGFDGGRMPEAPALSRAPGEEDRTADPGRNGNDGARHRSRQGARASWCRLTIPFVPLVTRKWNSPGNVTFRPRPPNGSQVPFSGARVVSRLCETVPMALSPVGDGHQTRTAGRGDRGDPWGDHHPAPFAIDRCGRRDLGALAPALSRARSDRRQSVRHRDSGWCEGPLSGTRKCAMT